MSKASFTEATRGAGSARQLCLLLFSAVVAALAVGCGSTSDSTQAAPQPAAEASVAEASAEEPLLSPTTMVATTVSPTTAPPITTTTVAPTTTTTEPPNPFAAPDWLGTRILTAEQKQNSYLLVETPPELADRRLETRDLLPAPSTNAFMSTVGSVPDDVLGRSTWRAECPVALEQLAYLTVSHFGFDGEVHTGELIVNVRHTSDVVSVFEKLFGAEFPMEQLRVISLPELDEEPAGDWNDTTGFTCREATQSGSWSEHAYGNAIDINPFHNPYLKGDRVIPERAAAYADRTNIRPGMIDRNTEAGQFVIDAFAEIGWGWGGDWNSLKDWMHFSSSGS